MYVCMYVCVCMTCVCTRIYKGEGVMLNKWGGSVCECFVSDLYCLFYSTAVAKF